MTTLLTERDIVIHCRIGIIATISVATVSDETSEVMSILWNCTPLRSWGNRRTAVSPTLWITTHARAFSLYGSYMHNPFTACCRHLIRRHYRSIAERQLVESWFMRLEIYLLALLWFLMSTSPLQHQWWVRGVWIFAISLLHCLDSHAPSVFLFSH